MEVDAVSVQTAEKSRAKVETSPNVQDDRGKGGRGVL